MSIIFPIVLTVIIFIMFIGFYMNDIVCVRAVMQKEIIIMEKNKISDIEAVNSIKKSSIISNVSDIIITKKNDYINIEGNVIFRFPILNITKKEHIKVKGYISCNKDFVVNAKVIFDIMDKYSSEKQ